MVVGTNSTPTRIPHLGCEGGNVIQCKAAQLWNSTAMEWLSCDTAGLWKHSSCQAALEPGNRGARPLSAPFQSALCCTGLLHCAFVFSILCQSALLCSRKMSSMFQLQLGKHSLEWKGKVCSQNQRGAGLNGQTFRPLVPDWFVSMQMRTPNPHILMGPKGTALIGQNRAVPIGCNCVGFQEFLYKGRSDGRNTVQVGSLVQRQAVQCRLLSSAACVRGPHAEMASRLCFLFVCFVFLKLNPVSHQKPFLVGFFFLRAHT